MCYLHQTRRVEEGDNPSKVMAESRRERTDMINNMLNQHVCVPATLGWRRASLVHKMHCMLHSFCIELGGNVQDLYAFLASIYSWTTDQGVESLQADVPNIDVLKLLPWISA